MRRRTTATRADGYALVALMVTVAVMLVAMSAAVPTWRYLIKNDREEELIFRGGEIADAIARYQLRNGNTLPASLDILVKGKFLRHAYKDPMSKDGAWRFVRPFDVIGGAQSPFQRGSASPTTTTTTTRPSAFSRSSTVVGGFQGVASTSTDKSLRIFNGRTRYDEWVFAPGQPRIIGKPIGQPAGRSGDPDRTGMRQALPPVIGQGRPGVPGIGPLAPPYVVPP